MLQPRYSKLSSFIANPLVRHSLPTGTGFGGSSLRHDRDWESIAPIAQCPSPVGALQQLPLIIEFGKIVFLAVWLWCLLGVNFCVNLFAAITNFGAHTPTASVDRY